MSDPHYSDDRVIVYHGDCREVLTELAGDEGWADAIVCDPPYELKFMAKGWDGMGVAFDPETWKRCYDVLKPGGYLLAFGGSRTWHRMAVAIEDAGFEMRDSIAWLYGSGFPKSMDVSKAIDKAAGATREVIGPYIRLGDSKPYAVNSTSNVEFNNAQTKGDITAPATPAAEQWQGWGTALKPAFEPIVVARKPLGAKTVAANVLEYGTGAINIDACRVAGENPSIARRKGSTAHLSDRPAAETEAEGRMVSRQSPEAYAADRPGEQLGRWPTNVVLDGAMADLLDQQSGVTVSKASARGGTSPNPMSWTQPRKDGEKVAGHDDSGGASRFFPVFKYQAKAPAKERPKVDGVAHPTVKPVELMRWLVRLVTPPGGTVIDPFAGSGTTIEAALAEGVQVVGIEYTAEYLPLIMHRIERTTP